MLLTVLTDSFFVYLESEKNMSLQTIKSYNGDFSDFFCFLEQELKYDLASLDIERINHGLIRRYLVYLNNKGLAKSTLARRLAALKSFYRYLVKKEIIKKNPLDKVSIPKIPKRLPRYLEKKEMAEILQQSCRDKEASLRNRALLELLYGAGLRVTELVQLDVKNIDLTLRYVRILGKGNRERIVPIGKIAVETLISYLEEVRSKWDVNDSAALFLNKKGGRLSDRSIRNIVKKYCIQAKTREVVSPHGIRHSFASHLLDNGADLRVVQELLGHKKISSTQVYTHVSNKRLLDVYYHTHPRA